MGNETFGYDSKGRLSQASPTFPGRESYPLVTNYLWDSLDRSQELTYPAQYGQSGNPRKKVEPLYDMASRVDTLKYDAANYASGFVYNAASQVESLNVGSQITETYTYDGSTGLLFEQEVKKGATTHLKLKYNYTLTNSGTNSGAKTGQLTGITDMQTASRSKAYVYDKLGRLKEAKGGSDAFSNPSWTQTYTYDRYGNRTGVSKSGSGAGSIPLDGLASLVYTNAQSQTVNNRITTSGYEYDPAGNQTRGQVEGGTWRRYKYDAAGRLAVVMDDSSNPLESYSYGASNERLVTVFGTGSGDPAKFYCWEGGQVIAEYHAGTSSNLVWDKNYVHLGGRLLATTDSGGTKYHHPDRLGTRLVTDTSGNVATEQANLPFGTALGAESTGTPTNRRFTSYDRSATTGMDYAVNRFYNPAQGRFNQVDPIGMSAASLMDPQSLNLYSYCGNDPINRLDPDGLFWGKLFGWIGKALRVVAIAVFVAGAILLTAGLAAAAIAGTWAAGGIFFEAFSALMSGVMAFLGGQPTSMIFSFLGASGSASAWGGFAANWAFVGVGATASFTQRRKARSKASKKPKLEKVSCPAGIAAVSASGRGSKTTLNYGDGTQEVRQGGSRAWRNNNPGNIRPGALQGEVGRAGGFAVFNSEAAGQAGIVEQLGRPPYPSLTVFGAISRWAPPADNNDTAAYQARVQRSTGINGQTQIGTLNQGQLQSVANAIRTEEGWIPGTVTCWRQKAQ